MQSDDDDDEEVPVEDVEEFTLYVHHCLAPPHSREYKAFAAAPVQYAVDWMGVSDDVTDVETKIRFGWTPLAFCSMVENQPWSFAIKWGGATSWRLAECDCRHPAKMPWFNEQTMHLAGPYHGHDSPLAVFTDVRYAPVGRLFKWRVVFNLARVLCASRKRAQVRIIERDFAPGGAGYEEARAEFEAVAAGTVAP